MLSRFLPVVCAIACLLASPAYAQETLEGHWQGAFTVDTREIGLSLDLARNEKSEWIASLGLPAQGMTGLVVMDVAVSGPSVSFVAVELRMARFELALGPDGTLKGKMSTPEGPYPVALKRTGEAKVELLAASPALSEELEGDWEGSLEIPNRSIRVVVHFRNQPDRSVAATINILDGDQVGLPLNNVTQVGPKVEFGFRVAHAGFVGTLNQESTALAGTWTQDGKELALTLRKK